MNIKIFLDGPTLEQMESLGNKIDGWTFNPSLCRKLGVTNYRDFAKEVLLHAEGKPVSFEVLADDTDTILKQADEIASWSSNVWVKVPITLSDGTSLVPEIGYLSQRGVNLNVTAVMTREQCTAAWTAISPKDKASFVSVFAGRIADTGVNPAAMIQRVVDTSSPKARILWASARQVYNVVEAENCGASIITLSADLLAKMDLFGKDLAAYSRETVAQFVKDAEGIEL